MVPVTGGTALQKVIKHQLSQPTPADTFFSDEKNLKQEFCGDVNQIMLKLHPAATEVLQINHFYSHLKKESLKTLKNFQSTWPTTFQDLLVNFGRNTSNLNL